MKKLRVSSATIWRWKKCGYLVPVQLGAMDRYRISDINAILIKKRRCPMSQPQHISEVMHQLVLNNPNDPWAQILRQCPFIQLAMLKKGYMSLDDLTDEEIDRLIQCDLDGLDIKELRRKEAQND